MKMNMNMNMSMTHYMELLAVNQPWNLITFMAVPVVLVEIVAITELFILLSRDFSGLLRKVNKYAGLLVGIYFVGIFAYLFQTAVVPLTLNNEWRGWVDVLAVGSYLLGVVPLAGIVLLELGFLRKGQSEMEKFKLHVVFVAEFLVVAHVAMIFGMFDPNIFS